MKRLRSVEQTMALFACVYLGMAVEDWSLGAPKDRLYANGIFALVGFVISGVLYLLRRRRERAQAI